MRGCGVGDIRAMLETGNLGGKCADLNALFVGLARAAGIPARDVYGVRVADVRTARVRGKATRLGRYQSQSPDWKRAWVKLAPGSKEIEFFEAS